jgi:hypothetical protein
MHYTNLMLKFTVVELRPPKRTTVAALRIDVGHRPRVPRLEMSKSVQRTACTRQVSGTLTGDKSRHVDLQNEYGKVNQAVTCLSVKFSAYAHHYLRYTIHAAVS